MQIKFETISFPLKNVFSFTSPIILILLWKWNYSSCVSIIEYWLIWYSKKPKKKQIIIFFVFFLHLFIFFNNHFLPFAFNIFFFHQKLHSFLLFFPLTLTLYSILWNFLSSQLNLAKFVFQFIVSSQLKLHFTFSKLISHNIWIIQ